MRLQKGQVELCGCCCRLVESLGGCPGYGVGAGDAQLTHHGGVSC